MKKMISLNNPSERQKKIMKYYLLRLEYSKPLVKRAIKYLNIENEEDALQSITKNHYKWEHAFISENTDLYKPGDKCLVCHDTFIKHTFTSQPIRSHSLYNFKSKKTVIYKDNIDSEIDNDVYCLLSLPKQKLVRKKSLPSAKTPREIQNTTNFCSICLEYDTIEANIINLQCEHKFCKDCVRLHLHEKINNGKIETISCPEKGCSFIFEETLLFELISEEYQQKYEYFRHRNEIEKIPGAKLCPYPNCNSYAIIPIISSSNNPNNTNEMTNIVIIEIKDHKINTKPNEDNRQQEQELAILSCIDNQHKFCSNCNQMAHPGLKCNIKIEKDFIAWKKAANTRKCPKCKTDIEKIGGCNHMTCSKPGCQYQFCWICMGKYGNSHYNNPLSPCFGLQNSTQISNVTKCRRLIVILRYIGLILLFFIALGLLFAWPGSGLMILSGFSLFDLIDDNTTLIVFFIGTYFCLSIALIPIAYICLAGLIAVIPVVLIAGSIYLLVQHWY